MAEQQTPAPMPGRSYYGFLLYISGWTGIFCYLVWALVPHYYLNQLGITYLPQRYWAVAIPSLLVAGVLFFVTLVYPGLNLLLAVPPHDIRNLQDDKTIRRESYSSKDFYLPSLTSEIKRFNRRNGNSEFPKDDSDELQHEESSLNIEHNIHRETDASTASTSKEQSASVPPVYDLCISEVCQILYASDS